MTGHSSFEGFFAAYAAALQARDFAGLAAMYAPSFFVAGPKGSGTFANDEQFIEWLRQVSQFNESAGLTAMEPLSMQEEWLSDTHAIVTVNWGAKFQKTGEQTVAFKVTYVMQAIQGPWQVLGYIAHTDQEDEMRALGLV